jgi:hypothetical protein
VIVLLLVCFKLLAIDCDREAKAKDLGHLDQRSLVFAEGRDKAGVEDWRMEQKMVA